MNIAQALTVNGITEIVDRRYAPQVVALLKAAGVEVQVKDCAHLTRNMVIMRRNDERTMIDTLCEIIYSDLHPLARNRQLTKDGGAAVAKLRTEIQKRLAKYKEYLEATPLEPTALSQLMRGGV